MDNKDIAREWFDIADTDLSLAEFLQKMHPTPCEIICYHCQQAAEKYLKGFLVLQGEQITKTHDLTLLNEKCCGFDGDFATVADDCLMLTDYGVSVRYPFPLEINEGDMRLANKRNAFMAEVADGVFVGYASPNGKVHKLISQNLAKGKKIFTFHVEENRHVINSGVEDVGSSRTFFPLLKNSHSGSRLR